MAKLLAERKRRIERNKLAAYAPYTKQREFHALGRTKRERLFMAGNQLGKTVAGSAETAIHATGRYPDWWDGREFLKPIRGWAAGETGLATRDSIQKLLIGPPQQKDAWGTGMIPGDAIVDTQPARGVPDLLDSVVVKFGGGGDVQAGQSIILFKSYEQGRTKFQADTIDLAWLDEEPDLGIYTEALTRTNATGGLVMVTFTPLLGMSGVVTRFIMPDQDDAGAIDRAVVQMTIEDAEHYSKEERARIIASYPAHEREARTKGVPIMGSGRIFPVSEDSITIDPLPRIPAHWTQIIGIDFGWDHPTAATHLAWDRDADVVYVMRTYRQAERTPIFHAAAIKPWGDWVPVAWPHDGLQHDKGSGEELRNQYAAQGLNMLPERATYHDGGSGVEAGLLDMLDRMQTSRLKVYSTCRDWFEEFRLYHRLDGKVVKERDDLMSATRYGIMMLRHAITVPRYDDEDYGDRRRTANRVTGY